MVLSKIQIYHTVQQICECTEDYQPPMIWSRVDSHVITTVNLRIRINVHSKYQYSFEVHFDDLYWPYLNQHEILPDVVVDKVDLCWNDSED